MNRSHRYSQIALAASLLVASAASAQAGGIAIGQSTLIGKLDYSDSFTVGTSSRPDGLYNDNSHGGYNVQTAYHGNPTAVWTPTSNFSFNGGTTTTCCGYPGNTGSANGGNDALTGVAQTGGGDFSFAYGLRTNYVVQTDAMINNNSFGSPSGLGEIAIESFAAPGSALGSANSLSVLFSSTSVTLDSAAGQSASVATLSLGDLAWHNFAVDFDQAHNSLGIYVDQTQVAHLNLSTFAGGAYANYSNAAVGAGSVIGYPTVTWFDNFQVGTPTPEPSTCVLAACGLVGLVIAVRRRK